MKIFCNDISESEKAGALTLIEPMIKFACNYFPNLSVLGRFEHQLTHATDEECVKIHEALCNITKKDSLYDQTRDAYLAKLIEQVEKTIREEVAKHGYTICLFIVKSPIIEIAIKDPRFNGFKFEWTESDKLKISL